MRAISVYASLDIDKNYLEFFMHQYRPIPHPCSEWYNIFQTDWLGRYLDNPNVDWQTYELAFVFSHSGGEGAAEFIKQKNPKIKIVTVVEPPPQWLLCNQTWGLAERMKKDCVASNLVVTYQEPMVQALKDFFKVSNIYCIPCPINIVEYESRINLSERKNIIAMTAHTNFPESPLETWKVINAALPSLTNYKTRCFMAIAEEARARKVYVDECMKWETDIDLHLKRFNECRIFVDNNICTSSGHMSLEFAAMHIPSVGRNGYLDTLFPELSIKSRAFLTMTTVEELFIMKEKLIHLANDETLYNEMVKLGVERLHSIHSYEVAKRRIEELLK